MIFLRKQHHFFISSLFAVLLLFSCGTTKVEPDEPVSQIPEVIEAEPVPEEPVIEDDGTITLLFAGDIMAHSVNYAISDYPKIWRDVKYIIEPCDLAFANIESPVDDTKRPHTWPNFNMPQAYIEAAIDAGFDVFSLANNHTNDQGLNGIKETVKTSERLVERSKERGENIYFSGLKDGKKADFTYNIIEKKGFKILFLPVTELLNQPSYSD